MYLYMQANQLYLYDCICICICVRLNRSTLFGFVLFFAFFGTLALPLFECNSFCSFLEMIVFFFFCYCLSLFVLTSSRFLAFSGWLCFTLPLLKHYLLLCKQASTHILFQFHFFFVLFGISLLSFSFYFISVLFFELLPPLPAFLVHVHVDVATLFGNCRGVCAA